jgi:non-ribosomal peptide synthetase-like protein
MVLFVGSPLYNAYFKMLGAKVSWDAAIFSKNLPACTDLVSIGAGSVVRKDSYLTAYRAESNYIQTGRVTLGRNTYVGEGAVLDIDTVMEDGSQLGHASSLQMGGRLAAARRYHGSPAEETETNYNRLEERPVSAWRKIMCSLLLLGSTIFAPGIIFLALQAVGLESLFGDGEKTAEASGGALTEPVSTLMALPDIAVAATLSFFAALLVGLLVVIAVPRTLSVFLSPDKTYKLYGVHHLFQELIRRTSNSKFFNELFGDSSFIVYFLKAIGYRFRGGIEQTGTNFGQEQRHDNPLLCDIGRGTMVSDGLSMINADFSSSTFRLSTVSIGAKSFFGNRILFPSQGQVGENCLLATKVMIPIDGPIRENIGLLGSPCFEIPRATRQEKQFSKYENEKVKEERIKKKNKYNFKTMAIFVFSRWFFVVLMAMVGYYIFSDLAHFSVFWLGVFSFISFVAYIAYIILIDWMSIGFKRLKPQYCSIYDDYFWRHEQHWKFISPDAVGLLNGTPFKSWAWQILGVRVGKKLFDSGCSIPEKTLLTIGDYCTLGEHSMIQCHSLEDGTFKSDYTVIGDGCTVGVNAFVHYGVTMGHDSVLDTNSFLMKGENTAPNSLWHGNPAQEKQAPKTDDALSEARLRAAE